MPSETDTRFQSDAARYEAYLESPEGRLRLDLVSGNLQGSLPEAGAGKSLHALDLGGGTGAAAIRLARLGIHVTLLDSSRPMLDIARRAAMEAGVSDRVAITYADATEAASLFPSGSFDVVLCHNLLEYVDDPGAVLRDAGCLMRGPTAIFSLLVRNRAGEVLKAALKTGDLAASEHCLAAEWAEESLYGGRVRLFTFDGLAALLKKASLTITAHRGVRVLADYLPPQISRSAEYGRILELERTLGKRREFAAIARYTHCIARHSDLLTEELA